MCVKVKNSDAKARCGESQRIMATAPSAPPSDPVCLGTPTSNAQAHMDNPIILSHLRDSYEFLDTCRMHYCEHCDEEWPVFDLDAWPQGSVAIAGPRAGYCETVYKAGWRMSLQVQPGSGRCSRCANPKSAYAKMFSSAHGQHLGRRWPGLSDLTWYEALLIARVHPVISVVTLTATGLLCYAGHFTN